MPAAVQAHRENSLDRNRRRQRKDVCVEVVWIRQGFLTKANTVLPWHVNACVGETRPQRRDFGFPKNKLQSARVRGVVCLIYYSISNAWKLVRPSAA